MDAQDAVGIVAGKAGLDEALGEPAARNTEKAACSSTAGAKRRSPGMGPSGMAALDNARRCE